MKTLQNFMETAKLNEQQINEGILKDLFGKCKNLFKAGGERYKDVLKGSFQKMYPKWYDAYEKLQNEQDVENAKKQLDELLAAVDKMQKDDSGEEMDDKKKAIKKLVTIGGVRKHAEDKKLDDLVAYCDTKIAEISKAQPEAAPEAEKVITNENEGSEEVVNPAQAAIEDPQQKKATQQLAAALGVDNNKYEEVAKRLQGMVAPEVKESLNEAQTAEEWRNLFKTVAKKDKEHGNEALLALILSYEKLKDILGNVKPDGIRALLSGYEMAKPKDLPETEKK